MSDHDIEESPTHAVTAHVDRMLSLLNIDAQAGSRAGIYRSFAQAARLAELLESYPLSDSDQQASPFKP